MTPLPLVSMSAPRWRPTPMSMTCCERPLQSCRKQNRPAIKRAIFLTIRGNCAARSATVPASSAWTCSFSRMWTSLVRNAGRMWTSLVRNAGVPATPGKLMRLNITWKNLQSAGRRKMRQNPCRQIKPWLCPHR